MDLRTVSSEERFGVYVAGLVSVIGHADRARPLRDYCVGHYVTWNWASLYQYKSREQSVPLNRL